MFPIKYIDNNLVWNKDNEVFAYYELIPYNYSFLSAEQKFIVHDSFRQLIAQSREEKFMRCRLQRKAQYEVCRSSQRSWLREIKGSCLPEDRRTDRSVSINDWGQSSGLPLFLGFKLMVTEEQLNLKNIKNRRG